MTSETSSDRVQALADELRDGAITTTEVFLDQLRDGGGAVATELTDHITHGETKQGVEDFYAATAITARDIAEIVAFAVSRPRGVSLNEILVRPTVQQG
jgi:NADP-dependent 3-hydroxy acid dehydrogenase YdfG